MKTFHLPILIVLILALSQTGCSVQRALADYRTRISALAYGDASPQEKFDGMAVIMVDAMNTSMKFVDPRKNYAFVEKFVEENEKALEKLQSDISTYQNSLSSTEKIKFYGRAATKPYARDLIELIPTFTKKLERRPKAVLFLGKLLSVFTPGGLL